jgi:hypothetical protein
MSRHRLNIDAVPPPLVKCTSNRILGRILGRKRCRAIPPKTCGSYPSTSILRKCTSPFTKSSQRLVSVWIILVEATEPRSCEGAWHEWEGEILEAQYEFVHFDGLNRWYIAEERSELKERFDAPPLIFDQFELAATVSVRNRLAAAECEAAAAERELERIRASASWRWTAPLRAVRDGFCRLAETLGS